MHTDDTRWHVVWTSKTAPDMLISSHQHLWDAQQHAEHYIGRTNYAYPCGHYRITNNHAFND